MRNRFVQMSLEDIYNNVTLSLENKNSNLVSLLEEHIHLNELILYPFKSAFYKRMGRSHIYHPDSFLWFLILKKIFGFSQNTQMINVLKCFRELRNLCGFSKVHDNSQISRFLHNFSQHIVALFQHLVDITEPICRKINSTKADYLIFDTTGIEAKVHENNSKFFNSNLKGSKKLNKNNPEFNPYLAVYFTLPSESRINPDFKQQYINGHFCYA